MEVMQNVWKDELFLVSLKNGVVIRCDLEVRQIDLLNLHVYRHAKALSIEEYKKVEDHSVKKYQAALHGLLDFLTVGVSKIKHTYLNTQNERYSLIETDGKRIQLDLEHKGIKDATSDLFWQVYKKDKKINDHFRQVIIKNYLRILEEIKAQTPQTLKLSESGF